MDDIDRVCHLQMKQSTEYHRYREWPAALHGSELACHDCPESFLTFAISNGLAQYARAKIGHNVREFNRQTFRPLLAYATGCFSGYKEFGTIQLHLPMIVMLLRAGLCPNEWFGGSTVWRDFLACIGHQSEVDRVELDSSWLGVCKVLLMHNADPNAYVVWAETGRISALHILDMAFKHLPHYLVDEVKTLIRQKRASLSSRSDEFSQKRKTRSGKVFVSQLHRNKVNQARKHS